MSRTTLTSKNQSNRDKGIASVEAIGWVEIPTVKCQACGKMNPLSDLEHNVHHCRFCEAMVDMQAVTVTPPAGKASPPPVRKPVRNRRGPRAKAMLPAIKELIALRATTNGGATRLRHVLAAELVQEIKDRFPKEVPPTEETLVKMISKAHNQAVNRLDREFVLSDLNNFSELGMQGVSAEAIGHVMRVQRWLESEDSMVGHRLVSVRQARWIARLYATVADSVSLPLGKTTIDIPILQLWQVAYIYAEHELMCEVSATPFNTASLDRGLRHGVHELLKVHESQVGSLEWFQAQQRGLQIGQEGGEANGKG